MDVDEVVAAIRAELPQRMEWWNLHVRSVSVQAHGEWPITVLVDDPTFDEPLQIQLDEDPFGSDDVSSQANCQLIIICALTDERLHAEPPPGGWQTWRTGRSPQTGQE
ncbi:hypothetical protein [Pseudonocardia xinjiangensis]|uniref:hypothetical protein n=1 Tax=Pseudonocardia xinjiangensis TaxID=75289 RepID=UPI00146F4618